ncbi:hypothetical protein Tco_0720270 [Tanacetum coccineum]
MGTATNGIVIRDNSMCLHGLQALVAPSCPYLGKLFGHPCFNFYKAARFIKIPTGGGYEDEGLQVGASRSYHRKIGNKDGSTVLELFEGERIEVAHFGLLSRRKTEGKVDAIIAHRMREEWQGSSAIYVKRRDTSTLSAQTKNEDQLMGITSSDTRR